MGCFVNIRQQMLQQQKQHIPYAGICTGCDDEFPFAACDEPRSPFKGQGIVLVHAGFQILQHIGEIAFHDVALVQLANTQFQSFRRNGDVVGNAVDAFCIGFADAPLEIHEACIPQCAGEANDRGVADLQASCDFRRCDETCFCKIIQNKLSNEFFFFCQLYAHKLRP